MTTQQVYDKLKQLSRDGGAWVAVNKVFSRDFDFRRFDSPSRVPDRLMVSPNPFYEPRIGWRGGLVDWTPAARIREQNRACGCE